LHKAKGYCPNQVHSDEIVLGTVRWENGPPERWPKVLNTKLAHGEPPGSSPLDQMVLIMAKWEAVPR
jgi:hypothetical protein